MKVKVYISNDDKIIDGMIFGIKKIEKTSGGKIITFDDYDRAYRAAKVFMHSGFGTVRILGKA